MAGVRRDAHPCPSIADACADAEEATSVEITSRFTPGRRYPLLFPTTGFTCWKCPRRAFASASTAAMRCSTSSSSSSYPLPTTEVVAGTTFPVALYDRRRNSNGQWEEWFVEEQVLTVPGIPDDVVPEFCGFSLDELADLQYVGRETVNGLSTRHYSATLDGEPGELWVASNGSLAKVLASKTGVGFTMTFSRWDEPQPSKHNGQGLAPGGETRRHEQPQRTDHRNPLLSFKLSSCLLLGGCGSV